MGNPAFDTLDYAQTLEEAGIGKKQAEAHSKALKLVLVENSESHATKADIKDLKGNIESLRKDTKADIALVRKDMKVLEELFKGKFTLIYWMFGIIIAAVAMPQIIEFFGG